MLLLALCVICSYAKLSLNQQVMQQISQSFMTLELNEVESMTYTVPLDHFNANNQNDFDIQYFVNKKFLDANDPNAPLFVLLGGEGPASPKVLQNNYVIDSLAKKHKGLMLSVEHRFYGASTPSLEMDKLIYCTAEQALMDYVEVISHVQEENNLVGHPVIVLGGSYSGNLAAWMRQKYPNVVEGAWASSAPVEAVVDFYQYLEVVQNALPKNTADLLSFAFEQWDKMTTTEEGRKELGKIFNTCTEFGEKDIQTFAESIGTALSGYVQYNSSNWKPSYESTDSICAEINEDIVNKYPLFIKEKYNPEWADKECTPSSQEESYKTLQNTSTYAEGNEDASGRSWFFQTCIAYGYYQAVSEQSSVKWGKLNQLQGSIDMCKDIYGIDKDTLYNAVDHINVRYGGKKPCVTNVAFTNGNTDPWHALGVTESDHQEGNLVQLIDRTSHCSDLYSEKENDVPELKKARHNELKFFAQVLANVPQN
ncbi:serine carboxypeptidase s28 family protein [Entamoeba histolytica]|uniref:Serine carboxypeptidase (S28) family protein n=5 Tax=Entamoeba TaxID=5758 RepID=C4LU03_ENTH1|nr:serine carboxypeptidase (S28) family protein [Entamoeba histolytica HM-1:IMSS]EAL51377.2 serine carboxypeptidase (S28) family protein [Entamoeba histolytica HM-1:IMSS]GAT92069.1 serine carboxypeptidase s28 family protein [Entamoeba histolytica]|eukprot:XP_656762.2 serine carboxypeptidase (S28) family protein [Entamoeba histolytica HM-1:IMSS]